MQNKPDTPELHRRFLMSGGGLTQLAEAEEAAARKAASARAMEATVANQPAPPVRPEGLPEAVEGWRANYERLRDTIAASPLETRQLKRMAAKALARTLSTAQKQQARVEGKMARKRRRAEKAAAKHATRRDS
jgi:hypothetical protein